MTPVARVELAELASREDFGPIAVDAGVGSGIELAVQSGVKHELAVEIAVELAVYLPRRYEMLTGLFQETFGPVAAEPDSSVWSLEDLPRTLPQIPPARQLQFADAAVLSRLSFGAWKKGYHRRETSGLLMLSTLLIPRDLYSHSLSRVYVVGPAQL